MAQTPLKAVEITQTFSKDNLSSEIVNLWETWKKSRAAWEGEKRELRNYLFATDTTKTSNNKLPWKNSTTLPKLTQIRDNLHANYFHALFPHDDWFTWNPEDRDSANIEKKRAIVNYMKNKLRLSGFKDTVSKALYDYIDYGNAFGEATYITETHLGTEDAFSVYTGPKAMRVSPFDIAFDITASDFHHAPKITRSLINLGTLKLAADSDPNMVWAQAAVQRATQLRVDLSAFKESDINKWSGLQVDGFGSSHNYLTSGMIDVLEFEGNIYDATSETYLTNHKIIVLDRTFVAHLCPFESWLGRSSKEHVTWRPRPDNLMGMGPLDNLVGMQYRVDHLENLKADVFDQIAHPMAKEHGYVEDWKFGPGQRIKMGEEADVTFLRPDTTALNADFQISQLLQNMEEFAGAPKQAMGIRTPGEKTAFEVQELSNAATRIFQTKIEYFEQMFIEPLLNQMLEQARRNLNLPDTITVLDNDYGVAEFMSITKEDLQSKGRLTPVGARHFARRNQLVQNLLGLLNSAVYQDPMVSVHISGLATAKMLEELLDIEKFGLVKPGIRIQEQAEVQKMQTLQEEQQIKELGTANEVDQAQLNGAGSVQ